MKFHVTQTGIRVPRSLFLLLASFVAALLVVTMLPAESFAARPPAAEKPAEPPVEGDDPEDDDSDGDGTPDRPDVVSAGATARVLGKPVEVLAQGTETIRVLVNPDGTLTQESYAAPVRVKDEDGDWQAVDYTLARRADGSYEPKAAPFDAVVGGHDGRVAKIGFGVGRSMEFTWPEGLPELGEPVVEGGVATFKVSDTADLLVSLTGEGLATRLRLNEAPATNEDASVVLGLATTKVTVAESELGQLVFSTMGDKKKAIQTSAAMVAWDSQVDEAGDPVNVVAVDATVEQKSSRGDRHDHDLTLTAPEEFLSDPGTKYPVFIDPDIGAVTYGQDTWIRNGTTIVDTLPYRLLVGRIGSHSSTKAAHTFMQWDNGQIEGQKILKADLHVFQYHSGSCQNRQMNIHPLNSVPWNEATTTWSNAPAGMTGTGTSVSPVLPQKGGTGCAKNGWIQTPILKIVQAWADGPAHGGFVNNGLTMNVPSAEASNVAFERRFCSKDFDVTHTTCNTADRVPYLSVTYNGPPQGAAVPNVVAARTFDGLLWAADTTPRLETSATDPESSKVKYEFEVRSEESSSNVTTCTTALVASGATASCVAGTALTDGEQYVMRARAVDEHGLAGGWSPWRGLGIDASAPGATAIACDGYADDTWYHERDGESTTCEFTSSGAVDFEWRRTTIGTVEDQPALPATGGAAMSSAIPVPTSGVVKVEARGRNKAGTASAWKTFTFGVGEASLSEPMRDDRSTSTFPIKASAGDGATSAQVQWRYAPDDEGDTTTGWTAATKVKVASSGATWTGSVTGSGISETPRLKWMPSQETGISIPSVVQVRVVFSYPGGVEMSSPLQRIQLIAHAFGSSFPVQDVGPGQVALFTGEFQASFDDVEVEAPGGSLSFGRSHSTLTGDPAGPAGVFGPGWKADFSGTDAGASGFEVTDNTGLDGTLILTSPEGVSYVYAHSSGTKGALKIGTYKGLGETKLEEDKAVLATVSGESGISHKLTLTEWDGTVTEFKRTTAGVWSTSKVTEPEDNSTTTFVRDSEGLITWVFAPHDPSVTCTVSTQAKGCVALKFAYTTTSGGKRVSKVELRAWDPQPGTDGKPGTGAMAFRDIAKYSYDVGGKLTESWRPQSAADSGPAKTTYEYTTVNAKTVVSKVTEPGLTPWRFAYDGQGRLETIKRARPAAVGSGDATWTLVYGVPLNGAGLPDLRASATAAWGQLDADAPIEATAVFEPDHVPASTPGSSDWAHASLSYFTRAGRTTNTADYGAGAWQIDSTRYDAHGNTIWDLDAAGRNKALAESGDPEVSAGLADKYATITVYNATGTRVEGTYSPMRDVMLDNGDRVTARTVTTTDYDDEAGTALMPGRPTAGVPEEGFGLAVEERTSVTDKIRPSAEGQTWDTLKTRYRYDKVSSGDGDGWLLKTPTRVTTGVGTAQESTTLTRFDTEGKVFESRSPGAVAAGTSNDPRTTKTVYYTADTSAAESACRSKPEWAGLTCMVKPAGAPSGGAAVPTTKTAGYDVFAKATRTEETSGSTTRTVVSAYDYVGRVASSATTLDAETITQTTSYDPMTGNVTQLTGSGKTEAYTYDAWGRALTRTDGAGSTATTTYDTAGRVKTANDGKGTTTYTYDGTDANGNTERRGLVTKIDTGFDAGTADVFTGAYDADGALVKQTYPGGYVATWSRDVTGAETGLAYSQIVGGTEVPLIAFTTVNDHQGRSRAASGPSSTQTHGYDARDRLTRVEDTASAGCVTRVYGFSPDSNRTSQKTYGPGTGGACQDSSGASTVTSTFDTGDRITTSGYVYDALGRTTTVPKVHTDRAGDSTAGGLTVAYGASDMVKSLTQTVPVDDGAGTRVDRQEFTLDASDRVSVITSMSDSVALSEQTNHYDGGDDLPSWVQVRSRPDGSSGWVTAWERNVAGLSGDLGVVQSSDGTASIQFVNLHDDVVATAVLGDVGLGSYGEFTEYGIVREGQAVADRYGWLGGKQRHGVGITGGLTLMGARLYNPATGRFLSMDPVAGGNDNTYVYPPDPVNMVDLNGLIKWKKKFWKGVSFLSGRGYIEGGNHLIHRRPKKALKSAGVNLGQTAAGNVGGRWGKLGRHLRIGKVAHVVKFGGRIAAKAFGWPVTIGATALDYAHQRYLRNQRKASKVWAPGRIVQRRR